jgi:hypothetical protein
MTRRKSDMMPVSESRDHIQGPTTAPVTLLEYGDYESFLLTYIAILRIYTSVQCLSMAELHALQK